MHISAMSVLSPVVAFLNLGTGDIILIGFLCLLMFGSKKLPELARAFGQSMKEFKKAASDVEDNFRTAVNEEDRKKAAAASALPAPPPTRPADSHAPEQKV